MELIIEFKCDANHFGQQFGMPFSIRKANRMSQKLSPCQAVAGKTFIFKKHVLFLTGKTLGKMKHVIELNVRPITFEQQHFETMLHLKNIYLFAL